jgi:hypothetical protein
MENKNKMKKEKSCVQGKKTNNTRKDCSNLKYFMRKITMFS